MVKLYVIPGHSQAIPGAQGHGYHEEVVVRQLATKIKELGGADVALAPFEQDCYAVNGINALTLPKDTQLLEIHLDASDDGSAHGGHVVIKTGMAPDKYDTALQKWVGSFFPGRASSLSHRSDLRNPNQAAARGYSYRLLEVCFVTSAADMAKLMADLAAVAQGILGCFGISAVTPPVSKAPTQHPVGTWPVKTSGDIANQLWKPVAKGGGAYMLKNKHSGWVLDVPAGRLGEPLITYPENGDDNQLWKLTPRGSLFNRCLAIESALPGGYVADVKGASPSAAPVLSWPAKAAAYDNQSFIAIAAGGGWYRLFQQGTLNVLDEY